MNKRDAMSRLIVGAGFFVALNAAHAGDLQQDLKRFDLNPAQVLNEVPQKRDILGSPIGVVESLFPDYAITTREYVRYRDVYRRKKISPPLTGVLGPIGGNDLVEELVDNSAVVRTLEAMESQKLLKAELSVSPWSDSYWPIYQGGLSARYADSEFPASIDWKSNRDYVLNNPMMKIFQLKDPAQTDKLSPAEKYSLVVGDQRSDFAKSMWDEGQSYADAFNGVVEPWMGYCHGWAAAAYMLPRPVKTITLPSFDGSQEIKFYPSDIKALATYLWARANPPTRFIGGRCHDKNPKVDAVGRIISKNCFDTNPGTWHMAVVNQIGVSGRSLVMDATYDYEVWNQPVLSYEYTYFNPQYMEPVKTLADATVEIGAFSRDKFKQYRSADTRKVAGVAMTVTYILENNATHDETDSPDRDQLRTVRYMYDLELDAKGEIVGGEWYSNYHPDFLWTPPRGIVARSVWDGYLTGSWEPGTALPDAWRNSAKTAAHYGEVLGKVVEGLFERAK